MSYPKSSMPEYNPYRPNLVQAMQSIKVKQRFKTWTQRGSNRQERGLELLRIGQGLSA